MMILTQGIKTASRWMYHQMISSPIEPMMGVEVQRVQKRPRTTTTNGFSSSSDSEPMDGVTYTDRRYVKVSRRRQTTNHSTNTNNIIIPRLNLSLQQRGLVDTNTIMAGLRNTKINK